MKRPVAALTGHRAVRRNGGPVHQYCDRDPIGNCQADNALQNRTVCVAFH
jgi:hypothetical protein